MNEDSLSWEFLSPNTLPKEEGKEVHIAVESGPLRALIYERKESDGTPFFTTKATLFETDILSEFVAFQNEEQAYLFLQSFFEGLKNVGSSLEDAMLQLQMPMSKVSQGDANGLSA